MTVEQPSPNKIISKLEYYDGKKLSADISNDLLVENEHSRTFAESLSIDDPKCDDLDQNDILHIVGAVSRSGFKKTFTLKPSEDATPVAKEAAVNILSAAQAIQAMIINGKVLIFDQHTQTWYDTLKTSIKEITDGKDLGELTEKDPTNIIGTKGVCNFLFAFSRIQDLACNFKDGNGYGKVTLAIGDRASLVIKKKNDSVEAGADASVSEEGAGGEEGAKGAGGEGSIKKTEETPDVTPEKPTLIPAGAEPPFQFISNMEHSAYGLWVQEKTGSHPFPNGENGKEITHLILNGDWLGLAPGYEYKTFDDAAKDYWRDIQVNKLDPTKRRHTLAKHFKLSSGDLDKVLEDKQKLVLPINDENFQFSITHDEDGLQKPDNPHQWRLEFTTNMKSGLEMGFIVQVLNNAVQQDPFTLKDRSKTLSADLASESTEFLENANKIKEMFATINNDRSCLPSSDYSREYSISINGKLFTTVFNHESIEKFDGTLLFTSKDYQKISCKEGKWLHNGNGYDTLEEFEGATIKDILERSINAKSFNETDGATLHNLETSPDLTARNRSRLKFLSGIVQFNHQSYNRAAGYFTEALSLANSITPVNDEINKYKQSIKERLQGCNEIVSLNARVANELQNIINEFSTSNFDPNSVTKFNELANISPKDLDPYNRALLLLGGAYALESKGDYRGAISQIEKTLSLVNVTDYPFLRDKSNNLKEKISAQDFIKEINPLTP